jgi:predicted nucleic acid-binding protein
MSSPAQGGELNPTQFLEVAKARPLTAEEADMMGEMWRRLLRSKAIASVVASLSGWIASIALLINTLKGAP